MKNVVFLSVFILYAGIVKAGSVDTISIYSRDMHRSLKCVVIKPDSYRKKDRHYPVLYLLHGYDGWFSNIIIRIPQLVEDADTYQYIMVCPEGSKASWYLDSPVDSSYRFESYIAKDVVNYIDMHYRTMPNKYHRAITGLSMGGHGALFLSLRHPDVFGAAGAMSGGFDLYYSRNKFDIAKRIGDTITHAAEWHNLSVVNLVENYVNTPVKIIFDCGNRDIFIEPNRLLHQKLLELKIPHDYIERDGEHNWDYWRGSIPYQLLYFSRFFKGLIK